MSNKDGSFAPLVIVMCLSLLITSLWNQIPFLKSSVHSILDPTAGWLLNWNLTLGMLIIVFLLSLITVVAQKYLTDQKTLKEMKKEQKIMQEEMKKVRDDPAKFLELQKKQMASVQQTFSKTLKLTSRGTLFTAIPFFLFFRWFLDQFTAMNNPLFFGFMTWFWFYLIFTLIFTSVLRKSMDVA